MRLSERVKWIDRSLPQQPEDRQGTLGELLRMIVARQPSGRLPPLLVLQDLLRRGHIGAGMTPGFAWESTVVRVDEEAYWELSEAIPSEHHAADCDAATVEEWDAWCSMVDFNVPYRRHLEFLNRLRALEQAREASDRLDLEAEYVRVASQYSSFLTESLEASERWRRQNESDRQR